MPKNFLTQLRLPTDCIIETVVSTYNQNWTPNASPMGVILSEKGTLKIKPYLETHTFKNLQLWKGCVVNLTQDPELFLRTVFKESEKLPVEWFEAADIVKAPRMRIADAFLEASMLKIEVEEDRGNIECVVVNEGIVKPAPFGYCRATFALIESIIHSTRVEEFCLTGKKAEAEKLLNLIDHYSEIVERIAPNSGFTRMMDELKSKLIRFRR